MVFRCFFLHFGVAMGLHPVSLQQCFRSAAAELLRFPENEMTIFFGTVTFSFRNSLLLYILEV